MLLYARARLFLKHITRKERKVVLLTRRRDEEEESLSIITMTIHPMSILMLLKLKVFLGVVFNVDVVLFARLSRTTYSNGVFRLLVDFVRHRLFRVPSKQLSVVSQSSSFREVFLGEPLTIFCDSLRLLVVRSRVV